MKNRCPFVKRMDVRSRAIERRFSLLIGTYASFRCFALRIADRSARIVVDAIHKIRKFLQLWINARALISLQLSILNSSNLLIWPNVLKSIFGHLCSSKSLVFALVKLFNLSQFTNAIVS